MTKKGKEKQMFASGKVLVLQIKESGRKVDETEISFAHLPKKFGFMTDIFSREVLNDSHSEAVKKAKALRELNTFMEKHVWGCKLCQIE